MQSRRRLLVRTARARRVAGWRNQCLGDLLNQELCGFEQRLSCLQPLLKQPLARRHPRLGKEPAGERPTGRRGMVCEAIDRDSLTQVRQGPRAGGLRYRDP